jgi:hypothetical protein
VIEVPVVIEELAGNVSADRDWVPAAARRAIFREEVFPAA